MCSKMALNDKMSFEALQLPEGVTLHKVRRRRIGLCDCIKRMLLFRCFVLGYLPAWPRLETQLGMCVCKAMLLTFLSPDHLPAMRRSTPRCPFSRWPSREAAAEK